jgi:RimJ/RimL family protein N-acetyltransferase
MAQDQQSGTKAEITLREVIATDIELFYEYQLDPEACAMARFPAREREAYFAHWVQILANETVVKRTIVCDGQVAGNIVSFLDSAGQREVGYWLGRAYWRKGVATRALSAFLELAPNRPLFAYAAKSNIASIRVLQKCGFTITAEDEAGTTLELKA